jgi:hypothetical protein
VERTTPWQADRVVFDYVLAEGAQAGDEQIAVRLVATSREMLETSMDRLAAAGIKPVLVGTSDDPLDQASPVNLLRDGQGDRRGSLRRRIGIGLAAIALLGAAGSAWAGWHLHQLESELVATGEQIRVTRTAIEAATARTEESAGYAKLVAQKKSAVPAVVLVDQLSQAIPTSTYLAQLVFGSEGTADRRPFKRSGGSHRNPGGRRVARRCTLRGAHGERRGRGPGSLRDHCKGHFTRRGHPMTKPQLDPDQQTGGREHSRWWLC